MPFSSLSALIPLAFYDGTVNKTFFGYYKDDGHKKRKNLGRVEQFNKNNNSIWKKIEEEWINLYRNKIVKDGMSAIQAVSGNDEWLREAYMKTDYSKLSGADFQKAINNYLAYMVVTKNKPRQTLYLNIDSWKEFRVGDLFSSIIKGKCGDASSLIDGDEINYIGAKYNNNGLIKSCAKNKNIDFISQGNCIAMIGQWEGSAGYVIYLDSDFIGASSLNLGYADWINPYTAHFVTTILCQEYDKYSFGRSWTGDRLKNTIIKLPVDSNGKPDWKFMEDYIKSLSYGDRLNNWM